MTTMSATARLLQAARKDALAEDVDVESGIPAFPMPRQCPMRPPAEYARMRTDSPVTKVALRNGHGRTAWLLTRREHVQELLVHPQVSADRSHPGFPLQVELPVRIPNERLTSMLGMDEPDHTKLRRMVIPEFTTKKIQSMRPRMQEIVDFYITEMTTGKREADLVEEFAIPVPSRIICEILGVPYSDGDFLISRSSVILSRHATTQQQDAAYTEVLDYFEDLVSEKEKKTTDDLLGRLIGKLRDSGDYERSTVVGMGRLMIVAGHEATPSMISLGTVAMLQNRELLDEVRQQPELMPRVVDELTRYFSISDQSTFRVALADIEIGGVTILAGEGIIGLNAAANWDDEFFANPAEIDIHSNTGRHLAFGFGPHQCIAQNLAKANLEIAYSSLFNRVPGLRLTVPVEELPFKEDQVVYGLHKMPVAW